MTSKLTPQDRAYDVCEKVGGYFYNHEQWEHLDSLGSMRELLESTIAAAIAAERDAALEEAAAALEERAANWQLRSSITGGPDRGIVWEETESCVALVRGMKERKP